MTLSSSGQVVTYEGTAFPEREGWERIGTEDADRFLENGILRVDVDLGVWAPPPGGEQDYYQVNVDIVMHPFWAEWRCRTNAPDSEASQGGGIVVNAWDGPVINHFTIASGMVRIWRGNSVPLTFLEIAPDAFHTFRVEIDEDQAYTYYIDGEVVDSGTTLAEFPQPGARIIWGARMRYDESSNEFDYLRFGRLPETLGDFDSDADVDLRDYRYFRECHAISGPGVDSGPGCVWTDFDADGDTDLLDFAEFQTRFTGQQE